MTAIMNTIRMALVMSPLKGGSLTFLLFVLILTSGCSTLSRIDAESIRTRKLEIMRADGSVGITAEAEPGGSVRLSLLSRSGMERISMRVGAAGGEDEIGLVVFGSDGRVQLIIDGGEDDDGAFPSLVIIGGKGDSRLYLGIREDGSAGLVVFNSNGHVVWPPTTTGGNEIPK